MLPNTIYKYKTGISLNPLETNIVQIRIEYCIAVIKSLIDALVQSMEWPFFDTPNRIALNI